MATPQPALQAELERGFEVVGNGWLPVQAEHVSRITPPERCQKSVLPAHGSWMLRISPVKLLFKGRVDMDKVRDWFMQTTETRSLAITRRCQFRKRLAEPGRRQPGLRKSPRRRLVGDTPAGNIQAAAGRKRWWWKGGAALRRARGGGRGLQEAGFNTGWRRKLPERQAAGKAQKETPPSSPRDNPERRRADKTCGRQQEQELDWSDLPSPPVLLHVRGTDYKLVLVGNRLPPTPGPMPHLGSRCPSPPRDHRRLLRQLGCLRECWVLLRNIADPRAQQPSLGKALAAPATASSGKIRSRRKRWTPAYCSAPPHRQNQRLLSTTRARSQVQPPASSEPAEDLPASPDSAPSSSLQKAASPAPHSPRPISSPPPPPPPPDVQQENLLSDVKWQLVCLKECRVTLRKIKDSNPPNGLPGCRPPSSKRPDPNLESTKHEKVGKTVRFAGTDSSEENQRECLAANDKDADVSAVLNGLKQHQEKGKGKRVRDTFPDTKWNRSGLKECYVVLKRISPLDGHRLANGQIFRLGRDRQNW